MLGYKAVIFLIIAIVCNPCLASTIRIDPGSFRISQPIQTWKDRRDQQVIKQQFDFSCGASSLATLLTHHFNDTYTETDILELFDHEDAAASFDDMKNVLTELGYQAKGYAVSFDQLAKITVPVILYVRQKDNDHFVVLRAIDDHHVHIADPSTGNRFYSKQQFLALWLADEDNARGKILAVMNQKHARHSNSFFLDTVNHADPIIFPADSY